MKKTFKSKLRLNSQTIRSLRLQDVVGGKIPWTEQLSCEGGCETATCASCVGCRACG